MKVRIALFAVAGVTAVGALLAATTPLTPVHAQPSLYQEPAAATTKTVWDGVYTQKQADRGKALYAQSCSACHGDDLSGQDMASALTGSTFMGNWSGLTVGALDERILTTMPMSDPGSLSPAATADIIAYMLSVSKFPAGQTELPQQAEVLKKIKIIAENPSAK